MTDATVEGTIPGAAAKAPDAAPDTSVPPNTEPGGAQATPDGPPVVATETPDMAPDPDGGFRNDRGEIDIVEWITSSCTGFFTRDEETITSFGENPVAWCDTNLPPDCGPQDISRCMPEILDRCREQGGDSESSNELARYCGTFSNNSSSTYTSSHDSSSGGSHVTYHSGTHCACDTVVNEICYTVNVYHQTHIYTHHDHTSTTGCFGDQTPCTTTELDDDFGCVYPDEVPVWDPDASTTDTWGTTTTTDPGSEDVDTPGMTPTPPASSAAGADKGQAAEAASDAAEVIPSPTQMTPGVIKEPEETAREKAEEKAEEPIPPAPVPEASDADPSATPLADAAAEAVANAPANGDALTAQADALTEETDGGFGLGATDDADKTPTDDPAAAADNPDTDAGFGAGATTEPVVETPVPDATPAPAAVADVEPEPVEIVEPVTQEPSFAPSTDPVPADTAPDPTDDF